MTKPHYIKVKEKNLKPLTKIIGYIASGYGKATGITEDIIEKNGYDNFEYTPYPGTLNISYANIDKQYVRRMQTYIRTLPHIFDKQGNVYYEIRYNGHLLYLIPYEDKVEVMAQYKLRDLFN